MQQRSTSANDSPHDPASATTRLLAPDEPPPVTVQHREGRSDFVLVCDHASLRLPRALGTLGLSEAELHSHVAWDIGAVAVARLVAETLDATLVMQSYSRLVIDCNRRLQAADSIPVRSESIRISGNENLDPQDAAARAAEIFAPYHEALRAILEQRHDAGRRTLLVAVHSFTPTYHGVARPWHVGLMYRHDVRLGSALVQLLSRDANLRVGDNLPYAIEEGVDYTIPVHGESRGIPHAGIEIRQDLIADEGGQKFWAGRLADVLTQSASLVIAA